jgi:hypothetical protein
MNGPIEMNSIRKLCVAGLIATGLALGLSGSLQAGVVTFTNAPTGAGNSLDDWGGITWSQSGQSNFSVVSSTSVSSYGTGTPDGSDQGEFKFTFDSAARVFQGAQFLGGSNLSINVYYNSAVYGPTVTNFTLPTASGSQPVSFLAPYGGVLANSVGIVTDNNQPFVMSFVTFDADHSANPGQGPNIHGPEPSSLTVLGLALVVFAGCTAWLKRRKARAVAA